MDDIFSLFDDQPEKSMSESEALLPTEGLNIQDGCLFGCRYAPEVLVIPETVRCIAPFAFQGKEKIKEIFFPKSLEVIERNAFQNCTELTSIHFAEDAIIYSINELAFFGCVKLSNLILPKSLECIGKFAFKYAGEDAQPPQSVIYSVNKRWLPDGGADMGASCGLGTLYLSPNLTIGESAFAGACLDEVIISANSLGESVFANAKINSVIWDSNIKIIPDSTFQSSTLGSFRFADINSTQLSEIGPRAFYDCKCLLSFEFPNSLTRIDDLAFYQSHLLKMIAPPGLKHIGVSAFEDCACTIIDLHNVDVLDHIGMRAFSGTPIKQLYLNTSQKFFSDSIVDGCESLTFIELGKDVSYIAFSESCNYASAVTESLTLVQSASTKLDGTPHTTQLMLPSAAMNTLDTRFWSKPICTAEQLKELNFFADHSSKIIVTYI